MQLETKRLWIREYRPEDWESVHAYASDPEVVRYMLWGPNSEEETRAFVQEVLRAANDHPRTDYDLALVTKDGNQLIGGCSLVLDGQNGEIGYCLHPAYWRQGYASEATRELIRWAFAKKGLHRISATCRPDNKGSAGVLEKVGMVREGHLREHLYSKGRFHDSYLYAILA